MPVYAICKQKWRQNPPSVRIKCVDFVSSMGFRGSLIDFVAGYVGFRYFSIHTIEVDSVAEGGF